MVKKKYLIIAITILESLIINAQPYYYTSTYIRFPYGSHHTGSIYRVNLSNPAEVESLMTNVYDLGSPISDEYGNWLAYEEGYRLKIINLNNPTRECIVSENSEGPIVFSFLNSPNKLLIKYLDEYSAEPMVLVDPNSLTITDTIPKSLSEEILTDEHVNFSKNGELMYVLSGDSILHKPTFISYSISTKHVIRTKYLEELAIPGSEQFYFYFRQNGLATVESYYNMDDPYNYYRIYFLDNDSLSIPIKYLNPADSYPVNDGKYLMMFKLKMGTDTSHSSPTGKIDIYDMTNGELKKTIQLPPDGQVMCFENYPNNVYYVKDIEEPTRQVWNLDMDSIFNVLDLTSLNPNSTNIGSSSFTLTINGKGFDTLSTVYFNGQPKQTVFILDSVLTAEILSSDVTVVGSFPVWVKDRYSISDTLQFSVTQASNPNLVVKLKNSLGNQIPASNVTYYDNSWKDAVNNGDGTFTVITTKPKVSIRVYYEYASLQADNVTAQNNTYTFQTVNAAVQLKNSLDSFIDAGTVQYYAGAWRTFGTTSNGVAYKELLPIDYTFRAIAGNITADKQQDISVNNLVEITLNIP